MALKEDRSGMVYALREYQSSAGGQYQYSALNRGSIIRLSVALCAKVLHIQRTDFGTRTEFRRKSLVIICLYIQMVRSIRLQAE